MEKPGEGRSHVQVMSRIGFLLVVGGIVVGRIMDGTIVFLFIPHHPHSSAKVEAPTHDP